LRFADTPRTLLGLSGVVAVLCAPHRLEGLMVDSSKKNTSTSQHCRNNATQLTSYVATLHEPTLSVMSCRGG
jgi:hypothetical protein